MIHVPKEDVDRAALARRVAELHAGAVGQAIRKLSCPASQKQALFKAVREAAQGGLLAEDLRTGKKGSILY